ncbi:RNA recognition motif domain-containing protein [Paraglaciecola hydrolytica]|uniref:RNA-binding protein n=1 Tax=Paraglaciecola hydrolytica TaxID=1799789 RepID=A0A136A2N6_9ALTE|nr:RNA-binding protein [Paraglaciecola hydrolytica]KXI29519.1 RNA-binding protein [Paraglaciecola hydrolytica]
MNSSLLTNIICVLILAVVGYFLFDTVNPAMSSAMAVALGVILGGLLSIVLSSKANGVSSSTTSQTTDLSTLYVGNLPYRANEQSVQEHFEKYGAVNSVRLMKDRRTGKRKGYGFVEMDAKGADKAIKNLNDSVFQERTLKVRLAKDKVEEEEQ